MYNKLMARKKPQKSPKFSKNQLLLGALLVGLLLAIAYLLAYVPYSIQKDKQRFLDAKPYLETVKTQIENTIGQADEVTYEENCNRANLKSSKGPLICSTSIELIFESMNPTPSSGNANKVAQKMGTDTYGVSGQAKSIEFTKDEIGSTQQDFSQPIEGINGLSCSILYRYTDNSEAIRGPVGERLSIYLSCGDTAKREHF